MLKEFRDFIMTGNVIDFAVAVIMAGAIGAVINGFVADIMMPIIGSLTGDINFADMKHVLSAAVVADDGTITKPENAILYGKWINTIISLITVGFVMFLIVKAYNKTRKKEEEAPSGPSEIDLLTEIRDALKK